MKTPSVLYHNYLREFWYTAVVEDLNPLTNDFKARPLKEFIIKFTMKNGQTLLTLDYKTFCETTRLDYNKGDYVAHPFLEVVKAKRLPPMRHSLLTGTKIDIGEIIFSDLVTKLMAKSMKRYVSYPRFVSSTLKELLGSDYPQDQKFGNLPSALSQTNFTKNPSKVTPIKLTASLIDVINLDSSMTLLPCSKKKGKKKTQTVTQPKPKGNKQPTGIGSPSTHPDDGNRKSKPLPEGTNIDPKDSGRNKQLTDRDHISILVTDLSGDDTKYQPDTKPLILTTVGDIQALLGDFEDELKDDSDEEMLEAGEELDEEFLQFTNEETQHPHATKTPTEEPISTEHQSPSPKKDDQESSKAKMSVDSPNASDSGSSSCSETFKPFDNYMPVTERVLVRELQGLNKILNNLQEVHNAVKEDPALNKKVLEADVTAQNDHLAKWTESSASMAWSVGPKMTRSENSQANIQSNIASLKTNTFEIKAMMIEIFYAFKGQSLSTPSSSVPKITLAITGETPSRTKGEKDDMITEETMSKTADVEKEPVQEP
ncbi:hypothetical protein Tco_0894898 [Tanacetum coccineum]|uniref:DUF223 domain-containing protein n=1 Tax=Tanacetum coccineum TaxID=301880 RepID=A0ABQ5CGC4_9ASTR